MESRSSKNSAIIIAIIEGNRAVVDKYIQANPKMMNAKIDDDGHTLLQLAIMAGQMSVASDILRTGGLDLSGKKGAETAAIGQAKISELSQRIETLKNKDDANDEDAKDIKKLTEDIKNLRGIVNDVVEKNKKTFVDTHATTIKTFQKVTDLKEFDRVMQQAAAEAPEKLANRMAYMTVDQVIKESRAYGKGDLNKELEFIKKYKTEHLEALINDSKSSMALTAYEGNLRERAGLVVRASQSDSPKTARVYGADPREVKSDSSVSANKQDTKAFYNQLTKILDNQKMSPEAKRREIAALKANNKELMRDNNIADIVNNALSGLERAAEVAPKGSRSSATLKVGSSTSSSANIHKTLLSPSPSASPAIRRKRTDSSHTLPAPEQSAAPSPAPTTPAQGNNSPAAVRASDPAAKSSQSEAEPPRQETNAGPPRRGGP